jgi:hypothetical protein
MERGRGRGREEEGGRGRIPEQYAGDYSRILRQFSPVSLSLKRSCFFRIKSEIVFLSVKCQDFLNFFWRGFDLPLFLLVVRVWRNFSSFILNIMVLRRD